MVPGIAPRRQLIEFGLAYTVRQVPVEREDRVELVSSTGQESIPVLVAGEEQIVTHLNTHFAEPPQAAQQRAKAAKARRKVLEKACLELSTATR